jgi:hypothetical protein
MRKLTRPAILDSLNPSPVPLLQALGSSLTDWMLAAIAEKDYGMDAEEHYELLLRTRDACRAGDGSQLAATEVIWLTIHDNPDTRHGHIRRAFASLVAMHTLTIQEQNCFHTEKMVACLAADALAIGGSLPALTLRYLAWFSPLATHEDGIRVHAVLALTILAVDRGERPEVLEALIDWVYATESETHRGIRWANRWLLGHGIGCSVFLWDPMIHKVLLKYRPRLSNELQRKIHELGKRLLAE